MVQFGRTLNQGEFFSSRTSVALSGPGGGACEGGGFDSGCEGGRGCVGVGGVVKSDWRCHAVAYMELKRALHRDAGAVEGEGGPRPSGASERCASAATGEGRRCDDQELLRDSVHTESSYDVTDRQKATFFRIYDDSVRRLTEFYAGRAAWAGGERERLEGAVRRCLEEGDRAGGNRNRKERGDSGNDNEGTQSGHEGEQVGGTDVDDVRSLIHRLSEFSKDLDLVLEFLELNATAFSKILKKYDKRTGSDAREAKLAELKEKFPYLYGGGALRECRDRCKEWTKRLEGTSRRDDGAARGSAGSHLSSSDRYAGSTREAGPTPFDSLVVESSASDSDVRKREAEESDNPQESSEMQRKPAVRKKSERTRKAERTRMTESVRSREQAPSRAASPRTASRRNAAPRSVREIEGVRALRTRMDRVAEELCLQKADSPFFDDALDSDPPPSFVSSELELVGELGHGEFCRIYEVKAFNVPESCHICFLHRGYNDPNPSLAPRCACAATGGGDEPREGATNPSKGGIDAVLSGGDPVASSFGFDPEISDYDDLESDHEEDEGRGYATRGFMKDHCLRNGEARYAIKRIRSDLKGEEEITDAAVDLAREAEFLAALKHPNIIRIRGTINEPGHPKYSLVLDRLYDTLEEQMEKWKVARKQYKGKFRGLIGKNKKMLDALWAERTIAAYDLSRALAFLHKQGVMHRDIKPANIGFDIRGDIKIFDFGLAKELKPIEKEGTDQYHTSGLAGTRRYMAPEVVQIIPYGLSADVYSFGILMWEMFTLKYAFDGYSREKHYKEVVVEGERPKVVKSWPFQIKNLLNRCWHRTPSERPSFEAVCQLIQLGLHVDRGREDDLLVRSARSHADFMESDRFLDESRHVPLALRGENLSSNRSPDPLSQSLRIKNPAFTQQRNLVY
ncbi:hypothetical protein ACHAWF_015345 [Thalassiosira exigua]